MIKVGIVGATGYTGAELLRLLAPHPGVEISVITSRKEAGNRVDALFPNLRGHLSQTFSNPEDAPLTECDVIFFATPNGTAMKLVPALLEAGVRVIDLAADFRIKDTEVWSDWYGLEHACPDLLAEAVYGLPELNREAIKKARLIANPGCYPTATTLGLLPLVSEKGLIDHNHIIADCKSGASGAGRKAQVATLFSEIEENFKAYGVAGHRHLPEIRQTIELATGEPVGLTFVPHLTPMIRGIHATLYLRLQTPGVDLQALFENYYAAEQFVDVLPVGMHPETRSVRGGNVCRIAVHRPQGGDTAVVLSVIDNLVKGAAGQAVQNMNIMFGLDEQLGLSQPALLP